MKILQINNVYAKGSTGKITRDLHEGYLAKGIDSIVLYGRGQKSKDPRVIKTCGELYSHINKARRMITGLMYGGCFFSTCKLIRQIKIHKPDIVHLQCLNGDFVNIYRLITWLKKKNIKTVLTLHAEFMHTANCGYALECEKWKTGCGNCPRLKKETASWFIDGTHRSWKKMKNAFDGFDNLIVVSVSPWLMDRVKISPFFLDKKNIVVLNGLDESVFHYYDDDELRKNMGLEGKKVVFHVTSSFNNNPNHIKGGYYIIEVAKRLKDITFVIAGGYSVELNIPDNVILLGQVKNQIKLAKLYSMADLTVLVSKKETFSMIVSESLCCGTPVVGFYSGGPETICIEKYCKFIDYSDIDGLQKIIRYIINQKFDKKIISKEAQMKYSKSKMLLEYNKIYSIINTGGE